MGLIPLEFWDKDTQLRKLEHDVFVEEIKWVSLVKDKEIEGMLFEKKTRAMITHLKLLFIKI